MSQFRPEVYKTDGGFSIFGLPILVLALGAAGVGLGWLASFISQWFYLILLFPAGIGVGLILVGVLVGRMTKMRSTGIALLLGLGSSCVAMTSMHYFDYLRFLHERQGVMELAGDLNILLKKAQKKEKEKEKDAVAAEAAAALQKMTADISFPAFLNEQAEEGVKITYKGRGGINLGYVGTWIYWGLELAGVSIMAALGLMACAMTPFCTACNDWKEDRELGTLRKKQGDVAELLTQGDLDQLKKHDPAPQGGDLLVTAAVCPRCKDQSTITVKLEEVTKNQKGEIEKKELVHLTYPGDSLAEFVSLFPRKTSDAGKLDVEALRKATNG